MTPNTTLKTSSPTNSPRYNRIPLGFAAGAIGGAVFGVVFGAVASIFEGGPSLLSGIQESWWWFSSLGAFAGSLIAIER